ncbi:Hcp family type VI secretion system effector [Pseudomonas sp. PB120]|uniref:Hcp family type VI secretion system effector n=1 Tax=Pseudomonas sp. PB120 TaxID=2494700 RepID=UPI0012FE0F50|nr:Hcp family type VI secretion system effector [Pseudomonas sp. PB120]MVV49194.1 Hcp family type VI secretion system effector [Pseudomonas sp. PB120]
MASPAYMSVTGEKQGLITSGVSTPESVGKSFQIEFADMAMVQAVSHEVMRPIDAQSGQPTGLREHKPFVVTKGFDKASPLLMAALCSGEPITKVEIHWYRSVGAGQQHYYTTTLEDAVIVRIKDYMYNCQDPATSHFAQLEDVHFSYRKITWTNLASSTSGHDDWRNPVLVG